MGKQRFYAKQSITSSDFTSLQELFESHLKNIFKAFAGSQFKTVGDGSILGTEVSAPTAFLVSAIPTSSQVVIYSGQAIDIDGEYIVSSNSPMLLDVVDYFTQDGTYYLYVGYDEISSESETDDKGDSYPTKYADSYQFDLTSSLKARPWIKIADITFQGGVVTDVTSDLYEDDGVNNKKRVQSLTTDRGTYLSSGTVGWGDWQNTMYDHVHGIGGGTVSDTNPHGHVMVTDWNEVEILPLYLMGNYTHGNGYSIYDPIDSSYGGYSSHVQEYDGSSEGAVRVSRFGNYCAFNRTYPYDTPNNSYVFSGSIYPVSSPMRQGGVEVWVDGEIDRGQTGISLVTIDTSFDWRYRYIIIEGFVMWKSSSGYTPEGSNNTDLSGYIDYTMGGTRIYEPSSLIDFRYPVMSCYYTKDGANSEYVTNQPYVNESLTTGVGIGVPLLSKIGGALTTVYVFADANDGALKIYVGTKTYTDIGSVYGLFYGLKVQGSPQILEIPTYITVRSQSLSYGGGLSSITLGDFSKILSNLVLTYSNVTQNHLKSFNTQLKSGRIANLANIRGQYPRGYYPLWGMYNNSTIITYKEAGDLLSMITGVNVNDCFRMLTTSMASLGML